MCRVIRTKLPKSQDLVNEKDADRIQLLIGSGCWWCDHRKATDGGWWHAEIAHLKASPYPEATDPFCRLPLSTLFYGLEADHLGDLMRIWVRSGVRYNTFPWIFKGRWTRTGRCERCNALPAMPPYLQIIWFQGRTDCKGEKRTLPRVSTDVSKFICVAAKHPHPGWGILTSFPFARRHEQACTFSRATLLLRTD